MTFKAKDDLTEKSCFKACDAYTISNGRCECANSFKIFVPELKCLTLSKEVDESFGKSTIYLIANGVGQGRWTSHFGVHCLADTLDTRGYLLLRKEEEEQKGNNPILHEFELKLKGNGK